MGLLDDQPALLKVSEVARLLRISKMTVYRMVHNGEVSWVAISKRSIRIDKASLEAYLRRNEFVGGP